MKKLFLTLTVILLSISFYPVKAMEKTADILKKNVVTDGDGLYIDSTVEGRYIYKGGKPNNYIKLGDDLYRIISLEKDGTIKVIKQESIGEMPWDEYGARYSTNSDDFCTNPYGCKAWGSNTTTLDSNGNKVTQMSWEVNGTLKNLPDKEATLNTYLNDDFYNSLSDDIKSLVVEKTWNIGPTAYNQTNLSESIKEESTYKWKGKVALMNATDYVKSSTNSVCSNVQDFISIYAGGKNKDCYTDNSSHNYLFDGTWTVSPYDDSGPTFVFTAAPYSTGYLMGDNAHNSYGVRPAFYLSSETTLNGEGTESNPYTISKYVEDAKDEGNNDKSDIKVDNTQVVEVPSTSAQISIIIASFGIIFIGASIIITKTMTKKSK